MNDINLTQLETGGTILGWIGSIIASVMFFITISMFGIALFSFSTFENMTVDETNTVYRERLEYSRYFILVLLFFFTLYCAFSLYASIQLIRSVNNRSSRQAKPFLILAAIETILAFLPILQFTYVSFCQAVVSTIFNGYIFICINSLWEMFRDEAMRGHNRQYQQGMMFNKV